MRYNTFDWLYVCVVCLWVCASMLTYLLDFIECYYSEPPRLLLLDLLCACIVTPAEYGRLRLLLFCLFVYCEYQLLGAYRHLTYRSMKNRISFTLLYIMNSNILYNPVCINGSITLLCVSNTYSPLAPIYPAKYHCSPVSLSSLKLTQCITSCLDFQLYYYVHILGNLPFPI